MPSDRQRLLRVVDSAELGLQVRSLIQRDNKSLGKERFIQAGIHGRRLARAGDTEIADATV